MQQPVLASGAPILERDAELERCFEAVAQAERREGAVVLLHGPAGIGKTSLARAVREGARERGFAVHSATGSELDRGFPFGLVHQLLDGALAAGPPERRARLLAGAAGLAEVVLSPSADAGTDPSHASLHGLYWLCANLAEERPLMLAVDDLHWGDPASLRFLEFLGRRLEGLPLLVLGAARPGEAGPAEELLGRLTAGPAAGTITLSPLTVAGVGRALATELGHTPDDGFVEACTDVTGGNPLLVRVLARTAREHEIRGTAAEAGAVASLAAPGVAGTTRRRLAGLGQAAAAVAAAVAILGDGPRPDDLAALTALSGREVADAIDKLVHAEVLDLERRAFVHPLIREALTGSIPPAERSRLHALAARRLVDRGAPAPAVAVHLLACDPAGEPWVVDVLRRAARDAGTEGAGETALAHLRRALAEPPPPDERAGLLLELGEQRLLAGETQGAEELAAALDAGLSGDDAVRARAGRASVRLLVDAPAAMAELDAARGQTSDPRLAMRLEAIALEASFYDARLSGQRAALLLGDGGPASPVLLAHRAVEAAYTARPAAEVVADASGAIDDGALVRAVGPANPTVNLLALALRHAEEPELSAGLLDTAEGEARRTGSLFARYYLNHARAHWHLAYGSLVAAEAHAREAYEIVAGQPVGLAHMAAAIITAEILVERDRLEEAAQLLDDHPIPEGGEGSVVAPDHHAARGAVCALQRRPQEALLHLRRADDALRARGWRVPLKGRVVPRLAEALHASGESDTALGLLDVEEEAARARGAHGTVGLLLRTRARIGDPAAMGPTYAAAEAELRRSAMRLELAWVLQERGAAARRAGQRVASREPLREALDLAGRVGAERLSAIVREELAAAGARPQRAALSGPASLTPSERRVAELAASGLTNREVAETLWVTRKTVELHLGRSYTKLGIRSRAQLAGALAD